MGCKCLVMELSRLIEVALQFLYELNSYAKRGGIKKYMFKYGLYIALNHIDGFSEDLKSLLRGVKWFGIFNAILDKLIKEDCVLVDAGGDDRGLLKLSYGCTERAEALWEKLSERDREVLKCVAEFVSKASWRELQLYTCKVYGLCEDPDIARVLKWRRVYAMRMRRKGLISIGLAAEIAGLSTPEFIEYLKKRGVKPFEVEESDVMKELEYVEKML
jgi:predicted HTH domain antitoxin